jgi:transcriptional repressor of dcmA and dcmR
VLLSERLFNTKEAAALLRVSQASIRRWSDAGLLPVRRIGRRRERRFAEADLDSFLGTTLVAASRTDALQTAVNVGGVRVTIHTHLATLYDSDAGRVRITVPFLADGLRAGQPCFLVASGDVLDAYLEALRKEPGVDIEAALRAGQFVVAAGPGPNVDSAVSFWEQSCWRAVGGGPTVLRITGEMACARQGFPSHEEMMRFEVAFNVLAARFPMVVLCQYDVREFDGQTIYQALKAHPDLYSVHLGSFLS